MAPAIRGVQLSRVELREKDLVGNAERAHRPTDIVQHPSSVPWSRAVFFLRVLLRFATVGQSWHTDSVARRAP